MRQDEVMVHVFRDIARHIHPTPKHKLEGKEKKTCHKQYTWQWVNPRSEVVVACIRNRKQRRKQNKRKESQRTLVQLPEALAVPNCR